MSKRFKPANAEALVTYLRASGLDLEARVVPAELAMHGGCANPECRAQHPGVIGGEVAVSVDAAYRAAAASGLDWAAAACDVAAAATALAAAKRAANTNLAPSATEQSVARASECAARARRTPRRCSPLGPAGT